MNFMLFGKLRKETYGYSSKAGLDCCVAAIKNFCHKKNGSCLMIVAKSNGNTWRLLPEIFNAALAACATFTSHSRHGNAANGDNTTCCIAKAVLTMHGLRIQDTPH